MTKMMLLLVAFFTHASVGVAGAVPSHEHAPSAAAVYEELERIWEGGDSRALQSYTEMLKSRFPGYVPSRLCGMFVDYIDGAQSELVVEQLAQLERELAPLLPWVSPGFQEEVTVTIKYHNKLIARFRKVGMTVEKRKARFSLEHVLGGSLDEQGFRMLFLLAPEIVLPMKPQERQEPLGLSCGDVTQDEQAYAAARARLQGGTDLTPVEAREAIAVLGVSGKEEALDLLCSWIIKPEAVIPDRAAEAVSAFGEAAVSKLLPLLCRPELDPSKELIIWALVRTGVKRPEIRDAVSAEGARLTLLKPYVEAALPYL